MTIEAPKIPIEPSFAFDAFVSADIATVDIVCVGPTSNIAPGVSTATQKNAEFVFNFARGASAVRFFLVGHRTKARRKASREQAYRKTDCREYLTSSSTREVSLLNVGMVRIASSSYQTPRKKRRENYLVTAAGVPHLILRSRSGPVKPVIKDFEVFLRFRLNNIDIEFRFV